MKRYGKVGKDLTFICHWHDCCKVGKLWVPYIIFRNTDSDEAVTVNGDTMTLVSVTKEGGFVRSGPEVADEVTSQ